MNFLIAFAITFLLGKAQLSYPVNIKTYGVLLTEYYALGRNSFSFYLHFMQFYRHYYHLSLKHQTEPHFHPQPFSPDIDSNIN